ncbi:hypothetical protein JARJAR_21 [Bacillus phage vB_BanH_JarJar]|nr:hypothetical protein JARJAR_21 [Bacillus phage vB_BanH_JarJar]UGO50326.1 hypothetical protein RONSWANSON_20 [Bacillus phage vB_BanH_RonSwanson]
MHTLIELVLELIGCLLDLLYARDRYKEDKKGSKKRER